MLTLVPAVVARAYVALHSDLQFLHDLDRSLVSDFDSDLIFRIDFVGGCCPFALSRPVRIFIRGVFVILWTLLNLPLLMSSHSQLNIRRSQTFSKSLLKRKPC